jgi:hypothetical protein
MAAEYLPGILLHSAPGNVAARPALHIHVQEQTSGLLWQKTTIFIYIF